MTENKMGVMPVGKLLVQMSLPLVASLLVSSAYNLVDSVYISRMGEAALSAVSLSAPIQTLTAALGKQHGSGSERGALQGSGREESGGSPAVHFVVPVHCAGVLYCHFDCGHLHRPALLPGPDQRPRHH